MQRTSGRLVAAGRCRADATRVVVHRTSQLLPRKHSRCCTAKAAASSARKSPAWDAPEVLVVGAGIAGLAAALALTKVKHCRSTWCSHLSVSSVTERGDLCSMLTLSHAHMQMVVAMCEDCLWPDIHQVAVNPLLVISGWHPCACAGGLTPGSEGQ
jgi:hypothetical protein